MPTPHNSASKGEIADVVLMPGDPMRAKYIAENFLENPVCFNEVRAMYGYTGMYKGKKVSVMGSGMGIPSMGIYSYELYKYYDVKKIIRIGSCGCYDKDLNLLDVVLVDKAYSTSSFAYLLRGSKSNTISSDTELTNEICEVAKKMNIEVTRGNTITSEVFDMYGRDECIRGSASHELNCIVSEMEAYALFNVAEELGKKAACLLSIVDNIYKNDSVSSEKREKALNEMIKIALESAILD